MEPLLISGLNNITHITVGGDFALALNADGRILTWVGRHQCELGRRLVERCRPKALLPTPLGLSRNTKAVSIHAGACHAFAIDSKGDTWAWGLNNVGQTGITKGAGEEEAVVSGPQRIKSLTGKDMKMVAGGMHHSVCVTESGECLVWGRIDGGQLGIDIPPALLDDPTKVLRDGRQKPESSSSRHLSR